jgi:fibronectin-binding autotransporter adhesin
VDIDGPGVASLIIDGGCTPDSISGICTGGGARPLAMSNGISVTLSGLTIQHGNAVNGDGGAILVGSTGSLTVLSCAFLNNVSSGASANGGGATASSGAGIAIGSSAFTRNSAGAGGTISTQGGGAIYMNGGTLNVDGGAFTENFTLGTNTSGGALLLRLVTTTVRISDLFVGSAKGGGGGIEQIGGTLTVTTPRSPRIPQSVAARWM